MKGGEPASTCCKAPRIAIEGGTAHFYRVLRFCRIDSGHMPDTFGLLEIRILTIILLYEKRLFREDRVQSNRGGSARILVDAGTYG